MRITVLSLVVACVVLAGLYALGFPERIWRVQDPRCEERVVAHVMGPRLARSTVRLTFREYYYFETQHVNLKGIFEAFQQAQYDNVINLWDGVTGIDAVTIAKILPPQYDFLEMPYHNFTMGNRIFPRDISGDSLPDPVFGSVETRCSTGRLDVVIPSNLLSGKIELSPSNAIFLTASDWEGMPERKRVPSFDSRRSGDLNGDGISDFIYAGSVVDGSKLWALFDGSPVDLARVTVDGWPESVPPNSVIIDSQIAAPEQESIEMWPGESIPVDGIQPDTPIHPIPDLDGDGTEDILSILPERIVILRSAGGTVALDRPPGPMQLGSIGDYDGDGRDDFWVSLERAENSNGAVVGRLYLLTNESFRETGGGRLEDFAKVVVEGDESYPNPGPTRIGSSLPRFAGDVDGDGVPDLITVSHYEFNFAGALYIVPGTVLRDRHHILASDPHIWRVQGKPLTYLGTGLEVADYDGDGYDDVLVGADVDHEAGFAAGAIYLLSGRLITQ